MLTCLALATIAGTPASNSGSGQEAAAVALGVSSRESGDRASRSLDRAATDSESLAAIDPRVKAEIEAKKAAEAKAAAEAKKAAAAKKAAEAVPKPVAGLSQKQMNNAKHIVVAAQKLGVPKRGMVIAVATSLQESQLKNLASTRIPESSKYTNEGVGSDHDSVGLFQQRTSTGWGSVRNLMNPEYAATAFYKALLRVPGWQSMALTYAAQRVQVSAYPLAYAKHESRARQIVDALT